MCVRVYTCIRWEFVYIYIPLNMIILPPTFISPLIIIPKEKPFWMFLLETIFLSPVNTLVLYVGLSTSHLTFDLLFW